MGELALLLAVDCALLGKRPGLMQPVGDLLSRSSVHGDLIALGFDLPHRGRRSGRDSQRLASSLVPNEVTGGVALSPELAAFFLYKDGGTRCVPASEFLPDEVGQLLTFVGIGADDDGAGWPLGEVSGDRCQPYDSGRRTRGCGPAL